MLTTGSITTETFSAALLGLEDLSLRLTAAAQLQFLILKSIHVCG
ncbi:hypothetical protein [Synechococcus lacustris]|nr:hypothetical protein [Synechococcus lacustris]